MSTHRLSAAALAGVALTVGCAGISGGRYRDVLQKLNKEKPGTTTPPKCESAVAGVSCQALFPDKDVSDIVGLARDVGALDPKRAGGGEERVYYDLLVDNAPVVDYMRHGAEGLYPGVPFLFSLEGIEHFDAATWKVDRARLTIHVVKDQNVASVNWVLARLHRGVVEAKLDDDAAKKGGPGGLTLPDATLGKDPSKMFDGLKYAVFKSKVFDGKTYLEYMSDGLLDAKIEEAQKEKDTYTFDVTAAVLRALDEQQTKLVLFLAPKVQRSGNANEPAYLFVATRAAAESLRPSLAVEYREPPPPEPEVKGKRKGKKK